PDRRVEPGGGCLGRTLDGDAGGGLRRLSGVGAPVVVLPGLLHGCVLVGNATGQAIGYAEKGMSESSDRLDRIEAMIAEFAINDRRLQERQEALQKRQETLHEGQQEF